MNLMSQILGVLQVKYGIACHVTYHEARYIFGREISFSPVLCEFLNKIWRILQIGRCILGAIQISND